VNATAREEESEMEKTWEYRRGPIAIMDRSTSSMECLQCGAVWHAQIRPGGQFYRGAWTCHNCGANSKDKFTPDSR
jgi:hypothetical protein